MILPHGIGGFGCSSCVSRTVCVHALGLGIVERARAFGRMTSAFAQSWSSMLLSWAPCDSKGRCAVRCPAPILSMELVHVFITARANPRNDSCSLLLRNAQPTFSRHHPQGWAAPSTSLRSAPRSLSMRGLDASTMPLLCTWGESCFLNS